VTRLTRLEVSRVLAQQKDDRSLQSSSTSSSFSTAIEKLTPSVGDNFGNDFAVAISKNRIVVGALGINDDPGAAYVYRDSSNPRSGRSYSQLFILTDSDGAGDHFFGESMVILSLLEQLMHLEKRAEQVPSSFLKSTRIRVGISIPFRKWQN
jgi:hypothetical protein